MTSTPIEVMRKYLYMLLFHDSGANMKTKIMLLIIFLLLSSSFAFATKPTISPDMMIPRTRIYGEVISSQDNILKINKIISDCQKDSGTVDIQTAQDYPDKVGQKVVLIAKIQDNKLIFDTFYGIDYYKKGCADNIGSRISTQTVFTKDPGATSGSEGGSRFIEIQTTTIEQDTPAKIPLLITNYNKQSVKFKLKEFKTYDLVKLNPGLFSEKDKTQRLLETKVDSCSIDFPKEEMILSANEKKQIELTVTCIDVSCVKSKKDLCQFAAFPSIEFMTPFDEWSIIDVSERWNNLYGNHEFYVKSDKPSEPSSSHGNKCSSSSECNNGLCLYCPSDTKFNLQTDPDPYMITNCKYLKEKYGDTAQCDDQKSIFDAQGGEQGYCGYGYTATCNGNWDNDDYFINFQYLKGKDCSGNFCIDADEKLPLTRFLTQDVLDLWKGEVLKTISKEYFDKNFDIESMQGMVLIKEDGNHEFQAWIAYKFDLGWNQEKLTQNFEKMTVAKKINGKWTPTTKEERVASYKEELERWHDLGKVRPTEYEIDSLISQEMAAEKLKQCDKDMKIEAITIGSVNKTLTFYADGRVQDADDCKNKKDELYKIRVGRVDLLTGEVKCEEQTAACVLYASKVRVSADDENRMIEPSQIYPQKDKGFINKIVNWFVGLF